MALERSNNLERDIFKLKDELEKSLKWTKSSKMLSNVTNQSNFNKKGLGSLNVTPPFNPHSKYVFVSDNLLCLHCGKNGHLKEECTAWRMSHEKLSKYTKKPMVSKERPCPTKQFSTKSFSKKGLDSAKRSFVKKNLKLPHWDRNTLITSLSAFWELKFKWVPKPNK